MTDEAISDGFRSIRPSQDYDGLYESAKCRSKADWLVGMNASRAFSLKYNTLLSVGRVQTPTLAILVKRRKEIENFIPDSKKPANKVRITFVTSIREAIKKRKFAIKHDQPKLP